MANIDKRIEFLATKFNIYMDDETDGIMERLSASGYVVSQIERIEQDALSGIETKKPLAVIGEMITEGRIKSKYVIHIHEDIFVDMIDADPTNNKMYVQWMLNVLNRLLKDGQIEAAKRLAFEDLPQANEYLILFDGNKRKRVFKEMAEQNLKSLSDPTNINQYRDLSQLFDAVDPFVERDISAFERKLLNYVKNGQGLIPVKDRNFTLFIPLTRDASVAFKDFASWCTTKEGNGMFSHYTNQGTPLSTTSRLYIVIENKFLRGEYNPDETYPTDIMTQIHVESGQMMLRNNTRNTEFYENVLMKSEMLTNYFNEELFPLAKAKMKEVKTLSGNRYAKLLMEFGYSDLLFELLDDDTPIISFKNEVIPKLPDMSKFKNVIMLILVNSKLRELNGSVFELPNLGVLSLANNKLTTLPKEIGQCKNLAILNLKGNDITSIPEEIGMLDTSRGGSLARVCYDHDKVSEEVYNKLKRLLPNALLTEREN